MRKRFKAVLPILMMAVGIFLLASPVGANGLSLFTRLRGSRGWIRESYSILRDPRKVGIWHGSCLLGWMGLLGELGHEAGCLQF